jgi:hypothetical protein
MAKKQKVLRSKGKIPTIMDITYGKTAYVSHVGAEMVDNLERSGLSICMTGEGMILTTYEAIEEFIQDHDQIVEKTDKTLPYIITAKAMIDRTKGLEDCIGDVVFVA